MGFLFRAASPTGCVPGWVDSFSRTAEFPSTPHSSQVCHPRSNLSSFHSAVVLGSCRESNESADEVPVSPKGRLADRFLVVATTRQISLVIILSRGGREHRVLRRGHLHIPFPLAPKNRIQGFRIYSIRSGEIHTRRSLGTMRCRGVHFVDKAIIEIGSIDVVRRLIPSSRE